MTTVSLAAGTTVNSAAETISATGHRVVVLAGGDQVTPHEINIASWQALARLSMLPGVRLKAALPIPLTVLGASEAKMREISPMSLNESLSLCVHEEAGLPAVLDTLSRVTGYAFDVSGSPAATFTLTTKGTLEEVLAQLSSAAGVTITVAH